MNAQLKSLVELQAIDSSILDKSSLIEQIPKKISIKEKPLLEARAKLEAKKKERDAILKKRKARETEVEELNQKITKFKSKTSEIKTNKEYQALLKEIEDTEKLRYRIEDEILSTMEEAENSERYIKTEEKNVKIEEEKIAQLKKELEKQKEEAEKELSLERRQRTEFAARIDTDLYELYMKLMRKYHGHAVAEVKNEICQGCNMSIMPQLFVEIKKGEEILQCPQCDRILYFIEEAEEAPSGSVRSQAGQSEANPAQ